MDITAILPQDAVLPELKAETRDAVLEELCVPLVELHPELEGVDLLQLLKEREALGSTAVGDGVAIPHGKVPGLSRLVLAAGRSRKGIDFLSPGGSACHILFLILAPKEGAGQYLRLLAQLAKRAKEPAFRSEIMLAKNREQLWHTITAP